MNNNKLYAVWSFDNNAFHDASLGHFVCNEYEVGAILAFSNKRRACYYAASYYGVNSYTEAKRKGWCEVVVLGYHNPGEAAQVRLKKKRALK